MKRKVSKKSSNVATISILIIIIAGIFLFYTRNTLMISSCTGFAGQNAGEPTPVPGNITVSGSACPGIPIIDFPEEPQPVEPPTPGSTNPPSSGESSSSSSYSDQGTGIMKSPENSSSTNQSVSLSPAIVSEKNSTEIISNDIIRNFILQNKLDLDCAIYNHSIQNGPYLINITGHRTAYFAGIKIKIPIQASLVVSEGKVILQCIKSPWWAHFFK